MKNRLKKMKLYNIISESVVSQQVLAGMVSSPEIDLLKASNARLRAALAELTESEDVVDVETVEFPNSTLASLSRNYDTSTLARYNVNERYSLAQSLCNWCDSNKVSAPLLWSNLVAKNGNF
jgi:hypothetical protein